MKSTAIATVIKMMESVPEDVQEQCVEHLRHYLGEIKDDLQWTNAFHQTQTKLTASAQKARREIDNGLAKPMNYDEL